MHSLGLDYINHACTFAEVGQAGVGVSARVAGGGGGVRGGDNSAELITLLHKD